MLKLISKILGGNKSAKDVKQLMPAIEKINTYCKEYASLSHDELRGKTQIFKSRIAEYLQPIS